MFCIPGSHTHRRHRVSSRSLTEKHANREASNEDRGAHVSSHITPAIERQSEIRKKLKQSHPAPSTCALPMRRYAEGENDADTATKAISNVFLVSLRTFLLLHLRSMIDNPNTPHPSTRLPHPASTRTLFPLAHVQASGPASTPALF